MVTLVETKESQLRFRLTHFVRGIPGMDEKNEFPQASQLNWIAMGE